MGVFEKIFILDLIAIKSLLGVDYGMCLIPLHVSGLRVSRFFIGLHFYQNEKIFVGGGLGQVPDTTPCLWFWGFQICYWVSFSQG